MNFKSATWIAGPLFALLAAAAAAGCGGTDTDTSTSTGGTSGACANAAEVSCGSVCADLKTDPKHCGSCSIDCTSLPGVKGSDAVCNAGKCVVSGCLDGRADCNKNMADGCETDTTTGEHCGSCDVVCASPLPVCAKDEGTGAYGCADGCPASTPTLCGTSCVNLDKDAFHCGDCSSSCVAPTLSLATCSGGVCGFECASGAHKCGGVCVNDLSTQSCGQSCAPCPAPPNGVATCDGTACGVACAKGYFDNGDACIDVNECLLGSDNCDINATCTNTPGSFTCMCNPGYVGDGVTCVNANECVLGTDNCDVNANCLDDPGGYICVCKPGYEGDGVTCTNIDECALNTDNCDVNAQCTDTQGGFVCTCDKGYSGNGATCTDINECVANLNDCSPDASCTNTIGSYTCACNSGFEGDGVNCIDVDECALEVDSCTDAESCVNTPGAYQCDCVQPNKVCGGACSDTDTDALNCGNCGASCASGKICVLGACVGAGNLRVTMIWSRNGDLDLHLVTPNNKQIFWNHKGPDATTDFGWLDKDDTQKRGPENIYWDSIYTPPSGTYHICIVPWNFVPDASSQNPVTFNVTIARPGQPDQIFVGSRTNDESTTVCTFMSTYYLTSFTYP